MDEIEKWLENEVSDKLIARKYVLVPEYIVRHKLTINCMYRSEPNDIHDSGWRFLHGNETTEIIEKFFEIAEPFDFSEILDIEGNEIIEKYLDSPIGSEYARNDDGTDFVLVNSPEIGESDVNTIKLSEINKISELSGEIYDRLKVFHPETKVSRQEFVTANNDAYKDKSELIIAEYAASLQLILEELDEKVKEHKQAEWEANKRAKIAAIKEEYDEEKTKKAGVCLIIWFIDVLFYFGFLFCANVSSEYANNPSFHFPISENVIVIIALIILIVGVVSFLTSLIVYKITMRKLSDKYSPKIEKLKKSKYRG